MRIADKYRANYLYLYELTTIEQLWECLRRVKKYREAWAAFKRKQVSEDIFQELWGLKYPCNPFAESKPLFCSAEYEALLIKYPFLRFVQSFSVESIRENSFDLTKRDGVRRARALYDKFKSYNPVYFDTENLIEGLVSFDLHNGEACAEELKGKIFSYNQIAMMLHPGKKEGASHLKPGAENVKAGLKFISRLCEKQNLLKSAYFSGYRDSILMLSNELDVEKPPGNPILGN